MYAIAALLLMICLQAPAVPSRTPNVDNSKSKHETKNSSTPTPSPTPIVSPTAPASQPTPSPKKNDGKENTERKPYPIDIIHQPFDVLMLAYVTVTSIAAFLALGTLLEIKKQVRLARRQIVEMRKMRRETVAEMKAAGLQTGKTIQHLETQVGHFDTLAKATKKSADALIESERARIQAQLLFDGSVDNYVLKVTNVGRTIGKITSYTFGFESTEPYTEPKGPTLPMSGWRDRSILAKPDVELTLERIKIMDYFSDNWDQIIAYQRQAVVFVDIVYEDVLGEPHETKICSSYRFSTGRLEDVQSYTKYT